MSTRYVFSYFTSLPDMDLVGERILISQWRAAWSKAGLTPIVLNEAYARRHPAFAEFDAAVSKLPSINPKGYDAACFYRWLAVQVAAQEFANPSARIVMADYDVFPYPDIPDVRRLGVLDLASDLHTHWHDQLYKGDSPMFSLHGNCPALVIGTPEQFAEVCAHFCVYDPAGKEHTSDQYIFEDFITKNPGKVKVSMDVILYGEPGWDTAAAVHYANSTMGPAGKTPKWQWIPQLRPV